MAQRSAYQDAVSTKAKRLELVAGLKVVAERLGTTFEVEQVDARCDAVLLTTEHFHCSIHLDGSLKIDAFTADWFIQYPTIEACSDKTLAQFPPNFERYCLGPDDHHRVRHVESHKATTVVADFNALQAGILGGFRRLRPILAGTEARVPAA
jgi:hypothetical protein